MSVGNITVPLSSYDDQLSALGIDWGFVIIVAGVSHDMNQKKQLTNALSLLDVELSDIYALDSISCRDNMSMFHMMSTTDKQFLEWVFMNVISELHSSLSRNNFNLAGYTVIDVKLLDMNSIEYTVEKLLPVIRV